MKKILISLVSIVSILGMYTLTIGYTTKNAQVGTLEITVEYQRQPGPGSNQYAIWIEDANGTLVKTLFVTGFTAKGGYEKRPDCTPTWVKKANAPALSQDEVDAFSGATPQSGNHVYTWDGTDNAGKEVAAGNYSFVVEATYMGKNIVVFRDNFNTNDGNISLSPSAEYNSDETQKRDMIERVTARYIQ